MAKKAVGDGWCCTRHWHWSCYVLVMYSKVTGVKAKLFADDVKVYVYVLNVNDAYKIQAALDLILDWASLWQLQVSVTKCSILNVGNVSANILYIDYHIHDTVLKCSQKVGYYVYRQKKSKHL